MDVADRVAVPVRSACIAVGPVVVGAIASAYSFQTAIALLATLYVLDIVVMWLLIPERRGVPLT